MTDDATLRQQAAAHPARSTWLSANAGSGKTRVLTDRVARLLLAGCAPERILCLTYTKAAASEMQNRLLRRLGEWAMLPEPDLRAALADLGAGADADLRAARRLFARAIETPGGLKVQTIHSFCAALLRRFPLEAGVPHQFQEMDERSGALMRAEIIDQMVEARAPEMADLLALHSGENLDGFLMRLAGQAAAFENGADPGELAGIAPGDEIEALLGDVFDGGEAALFTALTPHLVAGGKTDQGAAAKLSAGNWRAPGLAELAILEDVLLTGASAKEPFSPKTGKFPTKAVQAAASSMPELDDLMERVADQRPRRIGLEFAARSGALQRFARAFLRRYAAAKALRGWLDFDDLIRRAAQLLSDPSVAQWVLFRLDGGIDHILVDEAQDTSPAQWQVIERLTAEFTAGEGAAGDRVRSLFVVGDPKQSIYSFQGADVAVFEARRQGFDADFRAAGQDMQMLSLDHSFRSSRAVLELVDATFRGEHVRGLGGPVHHIAFHGDRPGRVDLWPVVPKPDKPEEGDWTDPVDQPAEDAETTVLARAIATEIRRLIAAGTPIYDAHTRDWRPVGAGDFLILVQRRKGMFHDIIRECKAAGLPIAGADVLKLAGELAVRDIRSVLAFLSTPEDDLALAEAMRSPLFGLSEDELYRLAAGRKRDEYLWRRLRDSDHAGVLEVLKDLRDKSGYVRPYDLISRLLVHHGGRERLLARLGPEAEDGIDELLSQALAYEATEPPSLTGFLVWLTGDDVTVKRQAGSGAGLIRVMTVHGAKGLEAPVVILPDTAKRRAPNESPVLSIPDAAPVWRGTKDERPEALAPYVAAEAQAREDERKRLLYVALTRAESWLIVAGAGETGSGDESWYAMIEQGFARAEGLAASSLPAPTGGEIRRLAFGDWPERAEAERPGRMAVTPDLPGWMLEQPATPRPPRLPVAATALGGAKVLGQGGGASDDPAEAMRAGTRLHLLLEHLPGRAAGDWPGIARAVLAGSEAGLPAAPDLAAMLDEVAALTAAPDLAVLFSPPEGTTVLAEVDLTAPTAFGQLNGTIDRLLVMPGRVLAVDYKSNADWPAEAGEVPLGILRQMGAYRAALRAIYPDRLIGTAVLWTRPGILMHLPDPVLDAAMKGLEPGSPVA